MDRAGPITVKCEIRHKQITNLARALRVGGGLSGLLRQDGAGCSLARTGMAHPRPPGKTGQTGEGRPTKGRRRVYDPQAGCGWPIGQQQRRGKGKRTERQRGKRGKNSKTCRRRSGRPRRSRPGARGGPEADETRQSLRGKQRDWGNFPPLGSAVVCETHRGTGCRGVHCRRSDVRPLMWPGQGLSARVPATAVTAARHASPHPAPPPCSRQSPEQ